MAVSHFKQTQVAINKIAFFKPATLKSAFAEIAMFKRAQREYYRVDDTMGEGYICENFFMILAIVLYRCGLGFHSENFTIDEKI